MDFEQGCLESDCERERLQEKVQIDNSRELQSSSPPVCSSRVSEFAKISGEVGEERNVKCQLLTVASR